MTLFFETGDQLLCFLAAVPAGFLIALCLCFGKKEGILRLVMDLLLLAVSGIAMVCMLLFFRNGALRLYHLLGVITGAILYLSGMNRVQRYVLRLIREKRHQKKGSEEGFDSSENEMINISG